MNILEAISQSGFKTVDFVILVIYLVALVALGLFLGRNKKGEEKSANDYFLAGNTLTWWAVGASLIAANISAEQFIGMSGTGYRDGIATAAYEIMAAVTLIIVGKFLLPIMLKRKIFTIPQFLRERYNDGVGLAFSIFWLILYIYSRDHAGVVEVVVFHTKCVEYCNIDLTNLELCSIVKINDVRALFIC